MRFLVYNADYKSFMNSVYLQHPELASRSFQEQLDFRYASLFGYSDAYSYHLKQLGHEAIDLYVNHRFLQQQWAREHGIRFRSEARINLPLIQRLPFIRSNWFKKILLAQVEWYKPDIFYTMAMDGVGGRLMSEIKKNYHCRIVGQHAATFPKSMDHLSAYDLVFSSLPNQVEHFRKMGIRSEYLPLLFDERVLTRISRDDHPRYDVVHVGGYGPIHTERNHILEEICTKIPVSCWGYGTNHLSAHSPILQHYQGEAWGIDRFNIIANSKITITKHITSVADGYANNMTLFEATGCGSMLLCDEKRNIGELFEPGKEIITYKNADDAVDKIRYYLNHEDERAQIAKAGQARTMRDHNGTVRMRQMLEKIQYLI